jgi:VWFA-related protein
MAPVFNLHVKFRLVAFALVVPLTFGILRLAAEERTADTPTTFSSNVKVVNVPTTVRDKKGAIVSSLTKDDFLLEEDGKSQTIKYFSRETDLPLTLGLLVDTSMSQINVLPEERRASYSFLEHMLRPEKDNAFVINFDFDVTLLQDVTSSRDKLQSALDDIHGPSFDRPRFGRGGGGGGSGGGGGGQDDPSQGQHRHRGGGTLFYDSVFLASDEVMKKQQGRKALIVLTDGDDRGSRETLDQAVEAAQRADTIVYSVLFADPNGPGHFGGGFGGPMGGGRHGGWGGRGPGGGYPTAQRNDGKKVLERISRETGGRMFEVSKKEPIEKIYAQIEEELRNQYSLGYTPQRAADAPAGYHKLHVATKEKDLKVQARAGYYGDK